MAEAPGAQVRGFPCDLASGEEIEAWHRSAAAELGLAPDARLGDEDLLRRVEVARTEQDPAQRMLLVELTGIRVLGELGFGAGVGFDRLDDRVRVVHAARRFDQREIADSPDELRHR